jgi:glycosyltransferase involved in cell wall biosynthesis
VVAIYADRLQRRGHEVTVVSTPASQPPLQSRVKRILLEWLQRHEHKAAWTADGVLRGTNPSHFDNVEVSHHVIDCCRPVTDSDVPDGDVVIATWWETAEWVARLAPRKGAKAYFIQHYEVFDYLPIERVKATWRMPLEKITISNWLAELATREYGDLKVHLVPNGVDMSQFHAPPRSRQTQPTVGILYASVKWKGLEVSLRAIERATKRVPGLRLIAFGSEPIARQFPLPPGTSFHHLPRQEAIRDLYSSCDVWLCGSYSEGFHLPPLEAMACRCPVVSTSVGGPMDIIEPGRNGYLVPVGDERR